MNQDHRRRTSVWLAIPPVLVVIAVWTNTDFPLDYWLHVNNGRWMVQQGEWITTDSFSHTIDDQPVSNQPWAVQLWMYWIHELGGYRLNQFVAGLAYGLAVGVVTWIAWRRSGSAMIAGLLGTAAVAGLLTNIGVRPQYVSALLFSVELAALCLVRRLWLKTVIVAACVALWSNSHGAFPLGIVLPVIFAAAALLPGMVAVTVSQFRRIQLAAPPTRLPPSQATSMSLSYGDQVANSDRASIGTFPATAKRSDNQRDGRAQDDNVWRQFAGFGLLVAVASVAAFVRPFPADTISYVVGVSSRATDRHIEEWLPTSIDTSSGPALFALVLVVMVVLSLNRRGLRASDLLLLIAFFMLSLTSQRMVFWWAMVFPVVLARPVRSIMFHYRRRWRLAHAVDRVEPRWQAVVSLAVLVGVLSAVTPWSRTYNVLLPAAKRRAVPWDEPYKLAEVVQQLDDVENGYAPLPWGSYLTWHSQGRLRSFVDSRVDFFPDDVWNEYLAVAEGRELATQILDRRAVGWVFCRPTDPLADALGHAPQWKMVYGDSLGIVYRRRQQEWSTRPVHAP